jgi:predicted glycogen debranching enzyme
MDSDAEWLESDGLGGYASGTVSGIRTRRYHGLLLTAATPPTGRVMLVNGIEAWIDTPAGRFALTSQYYAPGVTHPDGSSRIASFRHRPWPSWTFALPDGATIGQEIFVDRDGGDTVLRWQASGPPGDLPHAATLHVRPLVSGRDYHSLHRENPVFDFAASVRGRNVAWRPYHDLPAIGAISNGAYRHAPQWYRNFLYCEEQARGLDHIEDLASPGEFVFDLQSDDAVLVLRAGDAISARAAPLAHRLARAEQERRAALPGLAQSADGYLVDRGSGRTIIAGFPWFTDWGRDTFIAMRGLAIAGQRLDDAEAILTAWSGVVSEGMLPNVFPDHGDVPQYNAVDASLWFCIAVHEFLQAAAAAARPVAPSTVTRLRDAVGSILAGYERGTRFNIGMDRDGLVRAGQPGVQLTWMDAKVDDWVVTPRIGKPVEIQALWINALQVAAAWWPDKRALAEQARTAFAARFADPASGGLFDVVDADHVPGKVDARIRPNQIFAVGGLPIAVVQGPLARSVVDLVESRLLTPVGLRSLDPADPGYVGRYGGDRRARDGAYHQGTVWPFLIGPFIEAWVRTHGADSSARAQAAARFLPPLREHLESAGLGHVSEIADGDAPHTPHGCPFQAWSMGELIRCERMILAKRGDS